MMAVMLTGQRIMLIITQWLVIPVLVFAFNHSPAISQFSVAMKHEYGDRASERASVAAFIFITGWIAAVANPSILWLIESLAGP